MSLTSSNFAKIHTLKLQLEEAVEMLRLVAQNKRTCLEVEEWLDVNYPLHQSDEDTLTALMGVNTTKASK